MTLSTVSLNVQGNIGLLTVSNPPVNALSQDVRQGIVEQLKTAIGDNNIAVIILQCEGRTFIAGADITEFGQPPLAPHLPDVLSQLRDSPKPIIAALFGTVLGGGFEVALSCHYRIAQEGTKVGLPEVNLGLIPGAGGTQLLPRVAGIKTALEITTSGRPVKVESFAEQGLVDRLVTNEDLTQGAIEFAKEIVASQDVLPNISRVAMTLADEQKSLFDEWRSKLAKRARGQIAPQCIVDSIENAVDLPFEEGLAKEREFFLTCRASSQSLAMRHAFFAEKAAGKFPTKSEEKIQTVGVIGAGTMGGGIAICLASAGVSVILLEANQDNLLKGIKAIEKRYQAMVDRGRMTSESMAQCLAYITGSCDYQALSDVDLVIEAAFENLSVKKDIFAKLDAVCQATTILATNTSYLDIEAIALGVSNPQRVLGMHFFSPANIMKLLEVVHTDQTDETSIAQVLDLGKRIGKISVLVGICYGFVGNRMYACYGREANMLLLEGATPEQIDKAMVDWGMAMGPLAVNDMSGIDIAYKARKEYAQLPDDPLYFRAANLMVENNRLGQKNGAGFYDYDKDGKKQTSQDAIQLFVNEAKAQGVKQRNITDTEIQQRLICALVNEGARILEEGIARSASDIDVIWLNGYGFPRFRGGPMHYAESIGLDTIVESSNSFYEQSGKDWWKLSELLVRLAEKDQKFSDI